jgi:hypothetical protein
LLCWKRRKRKTETRPEREKHWEVGVHEEPKKTEGILGDKVLPWRERKELYGIQEITSVI